MLHCGGEECYAGAQERLRSELEDLASTDAKEIIRSLHTIGFAPGIVVIQHKMLSTRPGYGVFRNSRHPGPLNKALLHGSLLVPCPPPPAWWLRQHPATALSSPGLLSGNVFIISTKNTIMTEPGALSHR